MKYQWLLLDADGTLFDYDRAETVALEKTLKHFGHRVSPGDAQAYSRINSQIWLELERGNICQDRLRTKRFELLFETIGVGFDAEAFSGRYLENLADNSYLIEGAEEVVKRLDDRVGLLLITNGLKEVQRPRFSKSLLSRYFADIVISEEVGVAKPHGRIFAEAFSRMNNPRKAEVLMVGDSLTSDIRGGNDYGIDTCWFNPRRKSPDQDVESQYEIHHLSELLSIVDTP